MVNSDTLIARFRAFLEYSGRRPGTVRQYVAAAQVFCRFAHPLLFSRADVGQWMRSIADQRPASINSHLSAVRAFMRYLHIAGLAEHDQGVNLPSNRKTPTRLPRTMTESEVGRLLAQPFITYGEHSFLGQRDHTMMRVLWETGISSSELLDLRINDVDQNNSLLRLPGRNALVSDQLMALLDAYLQVRRKTGCRKLALWVSRYGRPLTGPRSIWTVMNRHSRAIGRTTCYGALAVSVRSQPWSGHYPHQLRTSFIQHLASQGLPIVYISQLTGLHPATVARHTGPDLTAMRDTVQRLRHNGSN